MYWNKAYECMDRARLETLQTERLIRTIQRVYYNVPFYRDQMQQKGMQPEDIQCLEDLRKLPFTTKQDLRDNYPYGLFAVPLSEIVRIHASSGTTGKPTVVGYTRQDIQTWSELMARTLTSGGTHKDSVIQIAFGYGLFTGGLGVHYGAERIGASVIPISGGNTKRQIMLMEDFGTTVLACTPSYALYLAETMKEMGVKRGSAATFSPTCFMHTRALAPAMEAPIAVSMATFSLGDHSASLVLASSSAIAVDLVKGTWLKLLPDKKVMQLMRVLCVVFVVLSFVMAVLPNPIVSLAALSWGAVSGSLLAPYIYGLFSKKVTKAGVWSGILTALSIILIGAAVYGLNSPMVPIISAAAIVLPLLVVPAVSLITKACRKEHLRYVFQYETRT